MKKHQKFGLVILLVAAILAVSLCACGSKQVPAQHLVAPPEVTYWQLERDANGTYVSFWVQNREGYRDFTATCADENGVTLHTSHVWLCNTGMCAAEFITLPLTSSGDLQEEITCSIDFGEYTAPAHTFRRE